MKFPKIHLPKLPKLSRPHFPKLTKRQMNTVKVAGIITVLLFSSFMILGSFYPGGWETGISIAPNGNVRVNSNTYTLTSNPGPEFTQYECILSQPNSIEQVKVRVDAPVHSIYDMQGNLIQTLNPSDHIEEYQKTYNGITYYFEHHLYTFTVHIRTLATVNTLPPYSQVLQVVKVPFSVWVTVEFAINPWQLVPFPNNQTYTAPDGSQLRYVDGWAGIMSAWVARSPGPYRGPVSGAPGDDNGGSVQGSDPGGQPENMYYVDNDSLYSGYSWTGVGLAKAPSSVLIMVYGGILTAGAHNVMGGLFNWFLQNYQVVDYGYDATIVVDVLQRKGFTLITGDLPPAGKDVDNIGQIKSWWDYVAAGIQGFLSGFLGFALTGVGAIVEIVLIFLCLYVAVRMVPKMIPKKKHISLPKWAHVKNVKKKLKWRRGKK